MHKKNKQSSADESHVESSLSSQNRCITIQRAADLLAVHPNTIRNLIARGELQAERIGARIVRVQEQDVQALLTPYVGGEFGVWK